MSDIRAWADSKLPKGYWVSVPEMSVAFDLHPDVVQGWIDSGEIEAVDFGGGRKSYWKAVRTSVLDFMVRRSLGKRQAAERSLATQRELFDGHDFSKKPHTETPGGEHGGAKKKGTGK